MLRPRFHIHVDAAVMPGEIRHKITHEFGLRLDNFEHSFEIEGVKYPGEHFTKYVFENDKEEVKRTCREMSRWAAESDFKGLIQCEFIVEDVPLKGSKKELTYVPAPFVASLKAVSSGKFKKHELHLELHKESTAPAILSALKETGLEFIENPKEITFTAAGDSKELLAIKKKMKEFIAIYEDYMTGHFTYEATAFWSLHQVKESALPKVVAQTI